MSNNMEPSAASEPTLVDVTLRDLLAAVDQALEAVPCICSDAYYDRRMVAPDCFHHDLADEFLSTYPCRCEACKRTESWRPNR